MRKADGPRFEREFKAKMKKKYYTRRLPTLRTGYAGLSQPADFILVGDNFNYVEVKETARDRFSISTLQQYPEIVEFLEYKERVQSLIGCEMNYWLIVRFIDRCVCAISNEDILKLKAEKRTLRCNTPEAVVFETIEDLREGDLF
ncbi:MAG TPA: hypothetical protein GXX72_01395 [Clostridiaceae bacterium]|nr:hypothetical protein [Clostridiaceae bacterium]